MNVNTHDAVCACRLEQIRHQTSRDGFATTTLFVLAAIGIERSHDGDALGRRPLERIEHNELLHDPLVDRCAVRLQDKHISATDALAIARVNLTVCERAQVRLGHLNAEVRCDVIRELRV